MMRAIVLGGKIITDANDIYTYFALQEQLKPHRVLDLGMFLKRIGAVTREAMGCCLLDELLLEGWDLMPELHVAVYETIYDRIYGTLEELMNIEEGWDLAVALHVSEYLTTQQREALSGYLRTHTCAVMLDTSDDEFVNMLGEGYQRVPVTVDHSEYIVVNYRG